MKHLPAVIGVLGIAVGAAGAWVAFRKLPTAQSPARPTRIAKNFALLDEHGNQFELRRHSGDKAVVLVTYGLGCPEAQQNLPALLSLQKTFGPSGVSFYLLDSFTQDGRAAVAGFASKSGLSIPVLLDPAQIVATTLGAERASEVFLIEPRTSRVLYHGAVDNRVAYGTELPAATRTYLADALTDLLSGRDVQVPETTAVGCAFRSGPLATEQPTYHADVEPILRAKCLTCHGERTRKVPPTNMETYEQVKAWAPAIEEALLTKQMPPWGFDPNVGKFRNDLSLSPRELKTLFDWLHGGLREGAPVARPAAGAAPPPPFRADRSFDVPGEIVLPAGSPKPWRYTTFLNPSKETLWVSAIRILDDGLRTHHTSFFTLKEPLPPGESDYEPEFKRPELIENFFVVGSSGLKQKRFPAGSALRIPAGSYVTLGQHFPGGSGEIRTKPKIQFELYRERRLPRPIVTEVMRATQLDIPPGAAAFPVTERKTLSHAMSLTHVMMHMHMRGRSAKLVATVPGRDPVALFSIPSFSYDHVNAAEFAEPVDLPAGTRLELTATFDNSPQNPFPIDPTQRVAWGPDLLKNEMLTLILEGF